jgi:hypothetical protein
MQGVPGSDSSNCISGALGVSICDGNVPRCDVHRCLSIAVGPTICDGSVSNGDVDGIIPGGVALRAVVRDDCSSSEATDLAAVVAELFVAVFLSVCVKVVLY